MAPIQAHTHHACGQSLSRATLELKHAQSTHAVDTLARDEDVRRLRVDIHILEDDNDELRELLQREEDRSDAFERLVGENLARAEDAEAQMQTLEAELRSREQALATALAETDALRASGEDVAAALTEKLAMARELSMLKPELEHLRAQAASTEALMADKLALQRQVASVQCELEHARREALRALAKRRNTGVEIAQEEQVEDLRRQLAKEQRARQRAEEAAEATQLDGNADEVRKELAREKRARQKAEEQLEEAQQATQIEDVRKDLLKEKKAKKNLEEQLESLQAELEHEKKAAARAAKRTQGHADVEDQAEELRQELAKEKKERVKAERANQSAADEFQAQKATLDDKLNQFRNKLRSTKEKLKETEAELAAAKDAVAATGTASQSAAPRAAKNPKKRNAAQLDPDATNLGTPGGDPAAKRGRKAAAGVGDKSTFSITPFLNRTVSAAPESDAEDEDASDATPTGKKPAKKPLATQTASKANAQPKKAAAPRRSKNTAPPLEMVMEETEDVHSQGQENANKEAAAAAAAKTTNPAAAANNTLKVKTKSGDGPSDNGPDPSKRRPKMRKSIHEFATFTAEEPAQHKKKRKLGGLGKTLFDEEEEASAPPPGKSGLGAGRALFGAKGLGAFGGSKKGAASLFGSAKAGGGTLLAAGDGSGFQFSPLKKSRRNLDDTLRG